MGSRLEPRIRVLMIDDHPMLRTGIATVLGREDDIELVGEAENGVQGVACFRELQPDITLMDIQMPHLNGIDAIAAIRAEFNDARIIALTTYKGDIQAQRALKAGAAGYLLKTALGESLIDTIRMVNAGRRYIPNEIAQEIALHASDPVVTGRELAVLQLVAEGRSNKEIAKQLEITEDTVKAHMKSIFLKLDVDDRTKAVTLAARRGMIDIDLN